MVADVGMITPRAFPDRQIVGDGHSVAPMTERAQPTAPLTELVNGETVAQIKCRPDFMTYRS